MFLSTHAGTYTKQIKTFFKQDTPLSIAVAFLGGGTEPLFDSIKHQSAARIICNFDSGATNPYLVEQLKRKGFDIRNQPRLHAKVLLSNNSMIIGSANLSANGLSLEGKEELTGWEEAGMLIDKPEQIADASRWFELQWQQAKAIDDSAIARQKQAWDQRRNHRPLITDTDTSHRSLLEAARTRPASFKDREIYLAVYSEGASKEAKSAFAALCRTTPDTLPDNIDFYEDWEDLPYACLISIRLEKRNVIDIEGLWEMIKAPSIEFTNASGGKSTLRICRKVDNFCKCELTDTDRKFIKKHIDSLWPDNASSKRRERDAVFIRLDEWLARLDSSMQ
ncbi:phospholipase D-like domain-containing protein [Dickeya zeae]|uniref:phospholipase D-like domain-containing protein n=1 Tax=Dickeya zeae TaxID=204042 RepID=UPI0020981942|nr:phospholipase D-like domain-containing protein [Dickeya zeae]MCO7261448.1 phospholipase D-like domain-containing protein [Dickeya zeae]